MDRQLLMLVAEEVEEDHQMEHHLVQQVLVEQEVQQMQEIMPLNQQEMV